jgi:runt-related transcription factor
LQCELFENIFAVAVLPDSTATDLDQHLSSLVGGSPTGTQMNNHQSILTGTNGGANVTQSGGTNSGSVPIGSTNIGTNGIPIPRYHGTASDYALHSSNLNGPRSLSDSSQAESPVQDDLLTSNTPNLGGSNGGSSGGSNGLINQNFSQLVVNQSQNSYSSSSGGGCNGSIYPVLPASLLYSQLYTAANQSHGFHSHALQSHASPNSMMHGELQSVMDHIATSGGIPTGGGGNNNNNNNNNRQNHHHHHHHQHIMSAHTDLNLIGNCGAAARGEEGVVANVRGVPLNGQRGQQQVQQGANDNGNSVWRPY